MIGRAAQPELLQMLGTGIVSQQRRDELRTQVLVEEELHAGRWLSLAGDAAFARGSECEGSANMLRTQSCELVQQFDFGESLHNASTARQGHGSPDRR